MSLRRVFRGSRANRDRRDQAYARSVIAEAAKRHNDERDLPPTADRMADAILAKFGDIEVCPDCMGTGEIIRYISDEFAKEQICNECNGTGWVK